MEKKKIKEKYEVLRKKHPLPSFDEVNNEFELVTIDSEEFFSRLVRRKISEKIEMLCKRIEEILSPDTNITAMNEYKFLSDDERKDLFEIYKKLMKVYRESMCLDLQPDEKKDAEFIKDTFSAWKSIRDSLCALFKKVSESWEKETDIKESLAYFG